MTQEERLCAQHVLLLARKKLTSEQICQHFDISRDSARRDLIKLGSLADVQRIRGGAILVPVQGKVLPYLQREQMSAAKVAMGKAAANLVNENDFIIIDSGTSLTAMAAHLVIPATVVTNSIDCLALLAEQENINVHLLGGKLNHYHRAILDPKAVKQLSTYQVNKLFLGVCALSESGLSTSSEEEADIKKTMIRQAQQVILVCDSSKFEQQNFHRICALDKIDTIITDQYPAQRLFTLINQLGIELLVVNENNKGEQNG
ncbi:DeoR/GlpR family DNA-binding transcription regulator [Psychromonas antarctica]|jgi:DeoR/GlpR family transcriptional regulator of sugar metabolism|uniref:DeoR/GlpR family DNA-binding transcription regulator n=1 Tax=Psychromonas antarctica TaxID=67573 RepID=UPI001EE8EBBC|nr:DeoR/GlpR family DNA-binding transcription regulator [Psychromonas antarctica]MCG6201374.1 DeoR/GlpR family DNA-binding transcription regulator [Psychromonas antarctica]